MLINQWRHLLFKMYFFYFRSDQPQPTQPTANSCFKFPQIPKLFQILPRSPTHTLLEQVGPHCVGPLSSESPAAMWGFGWLVVYSRGIIVGHWNKERRTNLISLQCHTNSHGFHILVVCSSFHGYRKPFLCHFFTSKVTLCPGGTQ